MVQYPSLDFKTRNTITKKINFKNMDVKNTQA